MEVNGPEARSAREVFFKLVFAKTQGLVCVAFASAKGKKFWREEFFNYPADLSKMLDAIEEGIVGNNVYFCPQVLRERRRVKENVEATPVAWADLDECHPDNMLVEPSIVVESSPDRFQAYWIFQHDVDPDDAENLSKRIAYAHEEQGADRSGWDLTQLLRVPYTFNYKHAGAPAVSIAESNRGKYRLGDFDQYPENKDYVSIDLPMPKEEDLPRLEALDMMQAQRTSLNPMIWRLFQEEPEDNRWSHALWNLEMLLFEVGFSPAEVYVIVQEAKCNKYARDGKPAYLLWKEVCRAKAKSDLNHDLFAHKDTELDPLLTDDERQQLMRSEPTFIERYQEWASSLGDAAKQYHQAGAFIALGSLLSGSVRLPTSFGTLVPNVWFMILADTTLTRKTTAMDIAMDLVEEIDEDIIMATDGSIEGLLTGLSTRPGRPSVFLRDEFSGLLEQMSRKDYMAGMAELLTKLYDGKMQKRILRKDVVEVRDPRLIVFAGGIKNKITGLLSFEHVSSGFMPRFVFITAESDITKLKPIGPPTERSVGNRDAILAELADIYKHYNRTQMLEISKLKTAVERKVVTDATLTDDAWVRYNKLEAQLLESGLGSQRPELMTPLGDRLAKSILKCSVLLAASRQRGEDLVVQEIDILRAILYGEQWRTHAWDVMQHVGKNTGERQLDTIYGAIHRRTGGVSRSQLMQAYHLNAREATQVFETLEQRGLITRHKSGRTEILKATSLEKT